MKKNSFLFGLIVCLSLSLHAQNWSKNNRSIKGNGNIIKENRTTESFNGINIGGNFDIVLNKGEEGKLVIEAEENIIPYIVTKVVKNNLQIRFKKNVNVKTTNKLLIKVSYASLTKLALGGSGTIESNNPIKTNDLKIHLAGSGNITLPLETNEVVTAISGSGNIRVSGRTKLIKTVITGSGSIHAYDLTTNEINAKITGSGSVKTTVTKKIKSKIIGSGNIYYKGEPTHIDSKTIGSGDVINKN